MAKVTYSATLNGSKKFTTLDGGTQRWSSGNIDFLGLWEPNSNDKTTATLRLKGSDWNIDALRSSSSLDTLIVKDVDNGAERQINYLRLGLNSSVELISTQARYIEGYDGDLHDVTLGAANTRSIDLGASVNKVTTGGGHVGQINLNGRDTVVVNSGGAGSVVTGDKVDKVTLRQGSWTDSVDVGSGNDTVSVNGASAANIWLGSGDDKLTLSNGAHVFQVFSGSGDDRITVKDDSRINHLELGEGNASVTFLDTARAGTITLYEGVYTIATDQGWIESITGWQTRVDLEVGTGSVASIMLNGAHAGRHAITADGWIGSLQIWDSGADILIRAGGADSIRLGEQRDTVTTRAGYVEHISTHGGDDTVRIGNGGAAAVRTGDGDDVVRTADAWVELISTGNDNDSVTLGAQGAGQVRLGSGDDILYVKEMDPAYGVMLSGGNGTDTIDFSAFTTGITFALDGTFYSVGAPGGDFGTPSVGYVLTVGTENVTGTDQADTIGGDANDNTLAGLGGNDELTGDEGADVFVFAAAAGTDTVTDFEQGSDRLRILDHAGGFGALVIADAGADLSVIHDGGTVILAGLAGTTLVAADFLFV